MRSTPRLVLVPLLLLVSGCASTADTSTSATAAASPAVTTPSPSSPGPETASEAASVEPSPTGPTRPSAATATPSSTARTLVLGGTELGVTRIGAPFDEAVRAVSAVLGPPVDKPPFLCIGATDEAVWGTGFGLAAKDGKLAGWSSSSTALETPAGVTVGTDLTTLERVYGATFERIPANPDNGPTFAVKGVDVLGGLSGEGDDAAVTSLFSGFCSGP